MTDPRTCQCGPHTRGKTDGSTISHGYLGEIVYVNITDGTDKTVNTDYNYNSQTLSPGVWLVNFSLYASIYQDNVGFQQGFYNIKCNFGTTLDGTDIGTTSFCMPAWGDGTSSYDHTGSCVFSINNCCDWTFYARVSARTHGTVSNSWFRVEYIKARLTRIS